MLQRISQLMIVGVVAGLLVAALALPAVGGLGITARNVAAGFLEMPSQLETPPPPQRSTIYDRDGGVIAEIFDQNRELVEFDDISPMMRDAILAIEDSRFYDHGGLDVSGTLRAAVRTMGGNTEGASSITQQYVKNVQIEAATSQEELDHAREETIARKIRELRYAIALEQRMTKDEILEGYLNIAYFSDGAYGVESAAQHFFQVPASELKLDQAATIAGLVRYPYLYNPRFFPEQTEERRNVVLDRMVVTGAITEEEAEEAKKVELDLELDTPPNGCVPSDQPFFCDYVVQEIEQDERFGPNETERARWLRTAGLEIHTTLDPQTQEAGQAAVDKWVPRENESRKVAAQAVIEPGTGHILGMMQSRNYGPDESKLGETSINFTTDSDRGGSSGFQAGSTFKAITLAAALDEGLPFSTSFNSPSSTTVSGQTSCNGGRLESWSLSNAGDSNAGNHNMISGTKASSNTFFAQLQARVGLCDTIKMAERLGLQRADGTLFTENENTLANSSFTLGSEEVSPMRVANAYATFASGGMYCEPQAITKIEDRQAGTTIDIEPECERAISEDVADGTAYLLSQTFNGGTAGSLDGSAAAWFAGFTPQMASAVFVGDPRGPQQYPLRNVTIGSRHFPVVYGATIPGPIWQETMRGAHEGLETRRLASAPGSFGSTSEPRSSDEDDDGDEEASPASDDGGVPNVIGMSESAAVAQLEDAGYSVNVSGTTLRSSEPSGSVAAINPDPGRRLPKGATVIVFLSDGSGRESAGGTHPGNEEWHPVRPATLPTGENSGE
ncbi:penicillin-binding protein [Nocardiopsis alba]|uniref:Penicillin binding transpeptidase domain protein n=1 Tax=Nocardiopsis alba (strain ATCC BAA-2165 / BE74) TaxID=1205910 RepID=J7L3Q1_NOCAA|nr:penicillin-binding protein [Nocardiopsis alba]AFR07381.1 penicillin binding transpeptidase domain protein [Nocardiopsis alba ATCC BAA-2165]